MEEAKTNAWNNNWFDVYDFTPHKFNTQNYRLEPLSDEKEREVRRKIVDQMEEAKLHMCNPVIPRIVGKGSETV